MSKLLLPVGGHSRSVLAVPVRAQAVCSQWGADPLARGAYSSIGVGANGGADYDTMARAVAGRVFFAGEATTRRYPATMHGAFGSGLRAVRTCTMVRLQATWYACEGLCGWPASAMQGMSLCCVVQLQAGSAIMFAGAALQPAVLMQALRRGLQATSVVHALPATASCMQAGSVAATLQCARDAVQAAMAAAAQAAAARAADEAAADARAAAAKKAAEARRRREPDAEAVAHVRRTLALARALDQARRIRAYALLRVQSKSVLL